MKLEVRPQVVDLVRWPPTTKEVEWKVEGEAARGRRTPHGIFRFRRGRAAEVHRTCSHARAATRVRFLMYSLMHSLMHTMTTMPTPSTRTPARQLPTKPRVSGARCRAWVSAMALGAVSLLGLTGCEWESTYQEEQEALRAAPRPMPVFVLKHHVGGTHHRVIVRGEYTYATYANSLLTISTPTGTVLNSLELLPFGTSGAAVDLQTVNVNGSEELLAVLSGSAVLRITLADPSLPEVVSMRRAQEIGFAPRAVSAAGGEVWIAGDAGVVPWSRVAKPFIAASPEESKAMTKARQEYVPPAPLLAAPLAEIAGAASTPTRGLVGRVVETDVGLVAPVGRRVYELQSGRFVGAASMLNAVPEAEAKKVGETRLYTFALQTPAGDGASANARIGIMGGDVREIDSRAVVGTVRQVKLLFGTLFAVTDTEIVAFSLSRGGEALSLGEPTFIAVKGARDLDAISDNDYAVVGSFGRARYRWRADGHGEADTFHLARREPSRLTFASTDRRRILAGGDEGSWLYTIGDEVVLVNQPVPMESGTRDSVAGGWGRASVSADRLSVSVTPTSPVMPSLLPSAAVADMDKVPPASTGPAAADGSASNAAFSWRPNTKGSIQGVESFDGKLWIWHDDGIDVLGVDGGLFRPLGAFRIEGPVKYLFPQRVGGAAAYVSEFGGFGLVDFVDRAALPSTGGQRLTDIDADGVNDVELTKAEMDAATIGGESARIHVPTGRDRDDLDMPKNPR
jgi:hypothetical protein